MFLGKLLGKENSPLMSPWWTNAVWWCMNLYSSQPSLYLASTGRSWSHRIGGGSPLDGTMYFETCFPARDRKKKTLVLPFWCFRTSISCLATCFPAVIFYYLHNGARNRLLQSLVGLRSFHGPTSLSLHGSAARSFYSRRPRFVGFAELVGAEEMAPAAAHGREAEARQRGSRASRGEVDEVPRTARQDPLPDQCSLPVPHTDGRSPERGAEGHERSAPVLRRPAPHADEHSNALSSWRASQCMHAKRYPRNRAGELKQTRWTRLSSGAAAVSLVTSNLRNLFWIHAPRHSFCIYHYYQWVVLHVVVGSLCDLLWYFRWTYAHLWLVSVYYAY